MKRVAPVCIRDEESRPEGSGFGTLGAGHPGALSGETNLSSRAVDAGGAPALWVR